MTSYRSARAHARTPLLALLPLFVFVVPTRGQLTGPTPPVSIQKNGIRVDVEMVAVNVTVTDPRDRLVNGLKKDDFRLYEDGVEQEISSFSSEDVPISVGLLFDTSGSMSKKLKKSREAAIQFLRTANRRDEFFLVSFNDRAQLTSWFTTTIEELENRMMFTAAKGNTALLDAIYLGLNQMRNAGNGKQIRNFLKEADCQLYAMGVLDVEDMTRTTEEHDGPSLLSVLAEVTGGRVFPVSRWNPDSLPHKHHLWRKHSYQMVLHRPVELARLLRWDEKAGLRRDTIRSQWIDALEAQ
jgi:Ca-activated chloride channel family protein